MHSTKYSFGMQFKFHYVPKYFLHWNDWIIFSKLNTIKDFATPFPSLTLHAVNLFPWKKILTLFKIITAIRPSTLLRFFLMRRSGFSTKGGTWSRVSPSCPKFWTPLLLDVTSHQKTEPPLFLHVSPHPSPVHRQHNEKKVSLISFRQISRNILPVACIFSSTIMTHLKKLVVTKSLDIKHCPAGLSPCIPLNTKNVSLL